jgi:hypothetical protein
LHDPGIDAAADREHLEARPADQRERDVVRVPPVAMSASPSGVLLAQ